MKSYTDILEALKGKQHKLDKNKNGKLDAHDFKLLRKEESEEADLDEGVKPGQGSKPGWMLKADPKLGAAVKAAQDLAKKRKASYGNPAAGKSVKEEAELNEAMSNDDKSSVALKALVAKKNLKQSGEKVKSVDFLKKMKDRIRDGENLKKEELDRIARSDYKVTPSGRKSHQQIVFKTGDDGKKTVQEAKMTDDQMAKREEIVKSMKKDIAGFKDRYGDRAKDVMYATATKMAMKEDNKKQDDLPFTPDKPKKTPVATPGKYGIGPSTAKHLAKMAMQKQMKKEETELDEQAPVAPTLDRKYIIGTPEHKAYKATKKTMVGHPTNQSSKPVKEEAEQIDELKKSTLGSYIKKASGGVDGAASLASQSVSRSSEGDGLAAQKLHNKALKRIKGIRKATDRLTKEEVELDEAAKGHTIEAHGIKGMKGTPWRKTFKHEDHLNDWVEKNDSVEVHGTRDLEHAKKGTSVREEVEELDERNKENATKRKMMDASRGARWKTQNKMSGDDVRDWDGKHKTPQAQNKAIGRALRNEENDTTEKNEMAQTQLHFVQYAAEEIMDYIEQGGVIEEWYQNKLSKVHSDMESLHSYMEGESRRTGMKEEVGKLERLRQSAQSYRARAQGRFTKPKNVGQTHDKDPHGGGIFAKSKPMKNEEVELDEMKSIKDIAAAAERRAGSVMKPKTKSVSSTQKSMSDIAAAAEKRKMKEDYEVEQIDEISADTARSYLDKSKTAKTDLSKAAKRFAGSLRAHGVIHRDELKKIGDRAAEQRKMKEDFDLDEVESASLSYKDFVSSLLEYETKDGVYRHKGSYGSSYQGDDDEPKKKPVDSTEKRGRGRPAGAKSGARGPMAKK